MIGLLVSPKTLVGAAIASFVVGGWAIGFHGPAQYRAGGDAVRLELTAATEKAARGIRDAAERVRVERRMCIDAGGMYDLARRECKR